MKDGGGSGCRRVDMKEFPSIWPPLPRVLSGIVRRTGAALRLCTLTNACTLFITAFAHKHSKDKGNNLCCFTAYLFSSLSPSFSLFPSIYVSPQQ